MAFVLDASVTLSWCLPDESNSYAARVLARLTEDQALVPPIWPLEVTNALVVAQRRNRLSGEQLTVALSLLKHLDIEVETPVPAYLIGPTVDIAVVRTLSVYDAAYVELARHRGCPLATADGRLATAAASAGVKILD